MTTIEIIDQIEGLLKQLREKAVQIDSVVQNPGIGIDFMLTRKEAAIFIGKSERQFDRIRNRGRIRGEIVEGRVMFKRSELERYKGGDFDDEEEGVSILQHILNTNPSRKK